MLLTMMAQPGRAWGQTTVTQTSFSAISGNVNNDSNVSYAAYKGEGTSNPAVNSNAIRLYQTSAGKTGGYVVIGVADGYQITSATIRSTMATTTGYLLTDNDPGSTTPAKSIFDVSNYSLSANTDYTVDDIATRYITFACFGTSSSSRLYLSKISITYESTSGGNTPSLSVNPASLNFGNKAMNPDEPYYETFTVTYAYLTENLTINVGSGLTGVSVSPQEISKDGDGSQIVTVYYNPTTEGEISGNITVSNTEDELSKTVAVSGSSYDPANVDTYELYTGEIVEGDYVIYNTFGALLNELNNGPRFKNQEVNISDNVITNPSDNVVWHIAPSGDYWTIYNDNVNKYAGGTSAKNQGALLDEITDHAKWTMYYQYGSLVIENYGRSQDNSDPSNRYLRQNSTSGWATYASGTGLAPKLYKKVGATTYKVTYNANGAASGSVPTDSNEYESGAEVTVLGNTGNLAKSGYVWAGWNTKADGTGTDHAEGSKFNISENTTLYAKWDAKTITNLTYSGTPTATQYAGQAFNPAGLTVTATFNDESEEDVTSQVVWTPNPLTIETTSVAGTYMGLSVVVEDITVTYAPGTQDNPYTVAQARAAIDAGTGLTGVYATGIVSEIVTPYSSQYHNISYNISSDGLTTNDQLQAYRGKSYNGDNFTSEDDIQVGDIVVVYGNLKKYNDIYEFDANNQLVSLIRKVATPTFSPIAGDVAAGTEVTIACATNGATIYYTTDGTDPTTSSNVYSEPILVNAAITIKAFAWKDGSPSSDIVTAEYTIAAPVATPTFSVSEGTYNFAQSVEIECTTEGATIYYTTDGNDPTTESTEYTEAIVVNETMTIKAIGAKAGLANSEVASATYTMNIPVINASNVNLAYDATNGSIAYTLTNEVEGGVLTAVRTEGDWLTVGEVSAESVALTCTANEGEADRTATVTLTYNYETHTVTKVVTVTQAHFIVDYATLPFEFDGGYADIESIVGLTQEGIDSKDYSSSPKLKFNNTDDWLILKINERPGTLTFDIKGNTFSGGTFTVQTSEDGETYTDLATYSDFGTSGNDTKNEVFTNLGENVRYIKWIYTNKSSGNVGLGNIALAKALVPVATPYFSPEGGVYTEVQNVTIACETAEATIYYTTDGSDPTASSTLYETAIPVATTTTIKAIAIKEGMSNSDIATATYTINIPAITLNSYSIEAPDAGASGTLDVTYHNITEVAAEVWFCNAAGDEQAEYEWITAYINNDNNVTYTINPNTGDARYAYFKVYALDDELNDVYSDLVTVTQAASVPKYAVNFTLDGGTFVPNEDFTEKIVEIEAGTYNLPSATKEGYTFDGWNDGNATYEAGAEYTVSADVEFTALWTVITTATINFNNTGTSINNANVSGNDSMGNTWTITTDGTTYFYTGYSYCQVGSSNNPATSITFTTTLAQTTTITAIEAKFGGFSETAGTITMKVGDETVGTGSLDATNDVTVTNTKTESGTVLTITVTNIQKGVKCYYISYTISNAPIINATVDPLAYSATSGSIIYEIDNYVAGEMAATTEADWISNFTYEQVDEIGAVGFTTTPNELYESRSATVTLTYTYDDSKATVTKDVTVTQAAAPIPAYIVSFIVGEGGTFVPNDDFDDEMVEVEAGTYTLPSATKEGYTFDGWNDGEQTYAAGVEYTVSYDVAFTATYTELQHITIHFVVNGEADNDMDVLQGTPVELPLTSTLTPDGFAITGWSSEPSSTVAVPNPYTPESEVTLYALLTYLYSEDSFELVTDASDLADGDIVVIAALNSDYAMSITQNNNNRGQAAIVKSGNQIALSENVCEFVLGEGSTENTWSFYDAVNEGYIYAASSSSNYLRTETELSANSSWTISIEENAATITAQGSNTHNFMQYNSSSSIFSCYASGTTTQQPICIYKKNEASSFNYVNSITEPDAILDTNIPESTCYVVEDGAVLTFTGTNEGTAANLVVQEGGQLIHESDVEATVQKSVSGYTNKSGDGWYLISSPVDNLPTSSVATGTYDLFAYDEATAYWWVDHAITGQPANHTFTTLERGKGYLYANAANVNLNYAGTMKATNANIKVDLSYACDEYPYLKGFNLVGNPFTRNITAADMVIGDTAVTSYYDFNADRTEFVTYQINERPIQPGQGFFIQATASEQKLVFNPTTPPTKDASDFKYISISAGDENFTDKAYIQFGYGNTLRKMTFGENTMVYVMNNDDDYAAARVEELAGTMPVHFVPIEDGFYTITVETKNIENLNYMHLIDNIKNTEIDLLVEPSYTFKASESDNADRFYLVFDFNNYTGVNENYTNDNFAHQIGDEIFVSGEGTLQVFDVLGRFVTGYNVNGDKRISTAEFNTGVYIFRMVGTEVKTQKIIVR